MAGEMPSSGGPKAGLATRTAGQFLMRRSAQLDARLCSVVAGDTLPRSSPCGVRRLGIDTGDQNLMTESRPILFDRLTWARWRKVVSSFAGSPDAGRRAKLLFAALL